MRLRVLVAVLLLALPAGSVAATDSGVVLHLPGRTEGIPADKLPPHDVPTKTYTIRGEKGSRQVTHSGISMTALFNSVGANVAEYKFLQIRRPDLSYMYLPPDTEAIVFVDSDHSVHFLRPLKKGDKTDKNATDVFKLDPGKPLVMTGRTGKALVVTLTASDTQPEKGKEVTFSAVVSNPPKNAKLTYTWRFGDGTTASGQNVKHTYDSTGRYN